MVPDRHIIFGRAFPFSMTTATFRFAEQRSLVDPQRTLDGIISTAGNGTNQSFSLLKKRRKSVRIRMLQGWAASRISFLIWWNSGNRVLIFPMLRKVVIVEFDTKGILKKIWSAALKKDRKLHRLIVRPRLWGMSPALSRFSSATLADSIKIRFSFRLQQKI